MTSYQKAIDKWFKKAGWKYWPPLSMLAALTEEVGELARLFNHLYGGKPKKATEKRQELEEELGDLIYTICCIANSQGVDLDRAFKKSLKKSTKRDKNRF